MSTAKHTRETLEIAGRLGVLADKVKLLALAANGLDEDANDDGVMLAGVAFEIEGEIRAIADEVHPPPTAKEIARLNRMLTNNTKGRKQ